MQAARAILADLDLGDTPADYLPRSVYNLRAYGHVFSAYGYRPRSAEDRPAQGAQSPESALLLEQLDREGVVAGVVGVNAGAAVRAAAGRIGERA